MRLSHTLRNVMAEPFSVPNIRIVNAPQKAGNTSCFLWEIMLRFYMM